MECVGAIGRLDRHQVAHLVGTNLAHRHRRAQRCASDTAIERVGNLFDRAAHHVRVDLTPQVRLRPSTDHTDVVEGSPGELLDGVVQPSVVDRDALHHRADEVGAGVEEAEVGKTRTGVGVGDRRSFALQPRCEDHPVGARRRLARKVVHLLEIERAAEDPTQPRKARSGGLVVVDDEVVLLVDAGHGRDHVEQVGLLLRHGCADPSGRAHRHMGLIEPDGPRADRRGVHVRGTGHHRDVGADAQLGGDRRLHVGDDGAERLKGWQLLAPAARQRQQRVVVAVVLRIAGVEHPRTDHRRRARSGDARETHRQVVDGFHQPARGPVPLGFAALQIQAMPDGIGAIEAGGATGSPDELGDRPRRVAADRASNRLACEAAAPIVHPHHHRGGRQSLGIDAHGRRPLSGDRDRRDLIAADDPGIESALGRIDDRSPPRLGVLGGQSVRAELGLGNVVLLEGNAAKQRHEPDLGPPGAEVDGEDETLGTGVRRSGHRPQPFGTS